MIFVPPSIRSLTGVRLYAQQFRACLVKRLHFVQRSRRGWFLEIILPALTVLLVMLVTSGFLVANDQPEMPINSWLMADILNPLKLATFFATNVWAEKFNGRNDSNASQSAVSDTRNVSEHYADHMLTRTGWSGAKCLPPDVYEIVPSKFAGCSDSFRPPSHGEFSLNEAQLSAVQASANRTCSCNSDGRFLCDLGTRVADILNQTFADARITALGLDIAEILRLNLPPTHFARIWYYNKGYPASVAYLNLLHNLQLRMLLPENIVSKKPGADCSDFAILASTQPMSPGRVKSKAVMMLEMSKSIGSVLALSYVPASFVVFLIRERCVGSKSLQFMSGLNRSIYWLSTYLWDVCNFLVPMTIITCIFLAFHEEAYVGAESVGGFIALIVMYGVCNIPLVYLFTFVFRVPSLAFVVLLATNLMIAVITSMTVFFLDMVQSDDPSLKPVNEVLKEVFLIFPQYALARGFYDMSLRHAIRSLQLEKFFNTQLFSWGLLGGKITILLTEAVIFVGAVLLIEYKSASCRCCGRKKYATASSVEAWMDEGVMEECGFASALNMVVKVSSAQLQDVHARALRTLVQRLTLPATSLARSGQIKDTALNKRIGMKNG
ncbi:unnamed protein product [Dibothriocephalus latus]|uniref:ABC-2 type transporter transmembrane domain-containing protein n=1 Tax=Dibothriocephalus latus TaxID=60516 RepID=A0A3P7MFC2_DIBLA|nr:unnamed protein product [Dibothriocephalus latus]